MVEPIIVATNVTITLAVISAVVATTYISTSVYVRRVVVFRVATVANAAVRRRCGDVAVVVRATATFDACVAVTV